MVVIAVIGPMLRREFDSGRPPKSAKGDLLKMNAVPDRCWKQNLIPDIFFVIDQFGVDINPAHTRKQPNAGSKGAIRKRMLEFELGEHCSAPDNSIGPPFIATKKRGAFPRNCLQVRHGDM